MGGGGEKVTLFHEKCILLGSTSYLFSLSLPLVHRAGLDVPKEKCFRCFVNKNYVKSPLWKIINFDTF